MSQHLRPIDAASDRGNRVAVTRRLLALFPRIKAAGIVSPATMAAMRDDGEAMGRPPGPGRVPRAPCIAQIDAAHRVRDRLAALPDDLDALQTTIEDALAEPAHEALTALQVGVAIDAFPSGQPADLRVYVGSIVAHLVAEGFGPQLVARALDRVIATKIFLPAVAELVATGHAARSELESVLSTIRMYRRLQARADEVIALAIAVPQIASDR